MELGMIGARETPRDVYETDEAEKMMRSLSAHMLEHQFAIAVHESAN